MREIGSVMLAVEAVFFVSHAVNIDTAATRVGGSVSGVADDLASGCGQAAGGGTAGDEEPAPELGPVTLEGATGKLDVRSANPHAAAALLGDVVDDVAIGQRCVGAIDVKSGAETRRVV